MKLLKTSFILILCFSVSSNLSSRDAIEFQFGHLESAKTQAGLEGKLYMATFYSEECQECESMDRICFTDPALISFVNQNVIPVKINTDQIDGYVWQQQYDIGKLPTTLVFSSKGKLLDRIENEKDPSEFINILKKHNTNTNKEMVSMKLNSSPKDILDPISQKRIHTPQITTPVAGKTIYRLQLGSFNNYAEALSFYQELSSKMDESIIVMNELENNITVYKILVGEYSSEDEAEFYRSQLKEPYNLNSFVY